MYPDSIITNVPQPIQTIHPYVLFNFQDYGIKAPKPLKFEKMWCRDLEFLDIVQIVGGTTLAYIEPLKSFAT